MKKLEILTLLTERAVGSQNAIDSVTLAIWIGSEVNVASSYLHLLWQQESVERFVSRERKDSLGRPKASYRYYVRKSANIRALLLASEAISDRAGFKAKVPGFDASALVSAW